MAEPPQSVIALMLELSGLGAQTARVIRFAFPWSVTAGRSQQLLLTEHSTPQWVLCLGQARRGCQWTCVLLRAGRKLACNIPKLSAVD